MKIKEQIITKSDVTQSKAKRRLETYSFDDLPVIVIHGGLTLQNGNKRLVQTKIKSRSNGCNKLQHPDNNKNSGWS